MIYLDNSATTKPCDKTIKYMNLALTESWGNPSSLHLSGVYAEELLNKARSTVAKSIGADSQEIYFTSGGTEANNIAVLGAANKLKRRGNRIITSAIEHPSVMEAMNYLEENGFEIIRLKPDASGIISLDEFKAALNDKTILVSIMLVNNEIGAIEPIREISKIIKSSDSPALLHTDAVQAFGKLPINIKSLGVDLLTASGHKIHGPKGSGFLYIKRGVNISTTVFGGGQESGIRSGTQAMPSIAGLLGAVEEMPNLSSYFEKQQKLWEYAAEKLTETGLVSINSAEGCLPYILNISVNHFKSETILHYLEGRDIFVSSGSACAKGKKSYVLESIGLSAQRIDSSIRISFSRYNSKEDIDILCDTLLSAAKFLRKAY